jgi:hypothetical protein
MQQLCDAAAAAAAASTAVLLLLFRLWAAPARPRSAVLPAPTCLLAASPAGRGLLAAGCWIGLGLDVRCY